MTTHSLRLAHISDLHFGRTNDDVVTGLIQHLNIHVPDLIVVGGDLTQGARPREFAEARRFLDRLIAPTLSIPGNHDLPGWAFWWRFLNGYGRYRRHIDADLNPSVRVKSSVIVGLNSSRRLLFHWDWSHGVVSPGQWSHLENTYGNDTSPAYRIVALHHPLIPPVDKPRQKLVGNAQTLAEKLSDLNVDLVLTGHIHTMRTRLVTDHFGHLPWRFPVLQTATTTSTRLRGEGNGLSQVYLDGDEMRIETLTWSEDGFVPHHTEHFKREPGMGWTKTG